MVIVYKFRNSRAIGVDAKVRDTSELVVTEVINSVRWNYW